MKSPHSTWVGGGGGFSTTDEPFPSRAFCADRLLGTRAIARASSGGDTYEGVHSVVTTKGADDSVLVLTVVALQRRAWRVQGLPQQLHPTAGGT